MSIITNVTLFFISVLKMFKGYDPVTLKNDPVTLDNALCKFRELNKADIENINKHSEIDAFLKSLHQLNNQHPLQLLEIAKESHCLAFNHILHLIPVGDFQNTYLNAKDTCSLFEEFKTSTLETASSNFIYEAFKILENLKLDQSRNEESFKILGNLMTIAIEFIKKIQDLRVRERYLNRFKVILFITENLAIDYQNGSIDHGALMTVFYEIKSLYFAKSKDGKSRKRLKNLKCLFNIYAALIQKSKCRLVFDFYPVEELVYLILRNRSNWKKTPFKAIFLGPKAKYLALKNLYDEYVWISKSYGKLILGVDTINSELLFKKRFFTKLFNFPTGKMNYWDYYCQYGFTHMDFYLWTFKGLSKIEYYLNSSKDFEME
jgi:hypothetical protein